MNINRRNFIKASVAGAGVAAIAPQSITEPSPVKQKYIVECYVNDKDECRPYRQYHIVNGQGYDNIEDAVQYVFEHVKEWDLTKKDVLYDILWKDNRGIFIQAGHYRFRDKETEYWAPTKAGWYPGRGWHSTPPHTNYSAVEFA